MFENLSTTNTVLLLQASGILFPSGNIGVHSRENGRKRRGRKGAILLTKSHQVWATLLPSKLKLWVWKFWHWTSSCPIGLYLAPIEWAICGLQISWALGSWSCRWKFSFVLAIDHQSVMQGNTRTRIDQPRGVHSSSSMTTNAFLEAFYSILKVHKQVCTTVKPGEIGAGVAISLSRSICLLWLSGAQCELQWPLADDSESLQSTIDWRKEVEAHVYTYMAIHYSVSPAKKWRNELTISRSYELYRLRALLKQLCGLFNRTKNFAIRQRPVSRKDRPIVL